jgi:hypothetical protein
MNDQEQQLATRLSEANYILVTVNSNPTFDQLAAAIGLTLMLNKMNKYATAIFSGQIPASLNFLNPEKTIEKTTDSLRDFIISLDKDKADKLRYKIEDNFVRIFISPYHSALSEKDFVFSMGDFNVDVVVALGIVKREELDKVIVEQGRILHDATIATINTNTQSTLGTINWDDSKASCLCEMLVGLSNNLKVELDGQIANSLLSGIIEETAQFSNHKTSSETMAAGSKLLQAGANQQLVSKEVLSGSPKPADSVPQQIAEQPSTAEADEPELINDDGSFSINHPQPEQEIPPVPPAALEVKPTPELPNVELPEDNPENDGFQVNKVVGVPTEESDFSAPSDSEDVEQIAIAPIMRTPMMTHKSIIMGQPVVPAPAPAPAVETNPAPPQPAPAEIEPPVPPAAPSPILQPVEALNAASVDLNITNDVEVPPIEHPKSDVDYGVGAGIEFSDPGSAPPPVPPPIITT